MVKVDQSEICRNRKHLFELHRNYSDNDNVEIGLSSFERNDGVAESLVNDQSKEGDIFQKKINPKGEKNTEESPILNKDEKREELQK